MTTDLTRLPDRLLASVIGLDAVVDRELIGWEMPPTSMVRLLTVHRLLSAAFARGSFHGSYGETFESPLTLRAEADIARLERSDIPPGWHEWEKWWSRYEVALSYFVLDLVAGTHSELTTRFLMWGSPVEAVSSSEATPFRGGIHS